MFSKQQNIVYKYLKSIVCCIQCCKEKPAKLHSFKAANAKNSL